VQTTSPPPEAPQQPSGITATEDIALLLAGLVVVAAMFYIAVLVMASAAATLALGVAGLATAWWLKLDTKARVLRWITAIYGMAMVLIGVFLLVV
jgi:hypothetical protein